MKVTTRTNNSS